MRSNLSEGPNSPVDCLSAKAATGGNPVEHHSLRLCCFLLANLLRSTRIWNLRIFLHRKTANFLTSVHHIIFLKVQFLRFLHFKIALYVSLKKHRFSTLPFFVVIKRLVFCLHLTTFPFIRHVFLEGNYTYFPPKLCYNRITNRFDNTILLMYN